MDNKVYTSSGNWAVLCGQCASASSTDRPGVVLSMSRDVTDGNGDLFWCLTGKTGHGYFTYNIMAKWLRKKYVRRFAPVSSNRILSCELNDAKTEVRLSEFKVDTDD